MNVGWVGLGKLGLPCALVLGDRGHSVTGYDVDDRPGRFIAGDVNALPWVEPGVAELLAGADFQVVESPGAVVENSDVVFVAVQTPHAPEFGGEMPVPDETRDFEYGYLVQAVRSIARAAHELRKRITLVVVSTVLPGTTARCIKPVLNPYVRLVYSPQFIAMGTTIHDFTNPEFLLLGGDDPGALETVSRVFNPVHGAHRFSTSVENAEFIKVAYNTFISMKIVWANHVARICDGVGADADTVVDALSLATDRIISPAYLRAGMGDGGACHPRDLIALADLERRLNVPPLFADIALLRDRQTRDLADLVMQHASLSRLPVVLLGKVYKPGVSLTTGSPALLLAHVLRTEHRVEVQHWDPLVDGKDDAKRFEPWPPAVYAIATRHPEFTRYRFEVGCTVIDPFGFIPDQSGVTLVRPGRPGCAPVDR